MGGAGADAPAVAPAAEPAALAARRWPRRGGALGLGRGWPAAQLLVDPTCSFSRSAAARLGREALDGRLQLRVVPVAVLGADAARRAAAIAAHPEPVRAWFEGGGTADRTGAERIARNNALFDQWGVTAVPLIAWQTPGGAVGRRIGDIDDVGAWLQETLVPDTLRVGDPRAGEPRPRDPRVGESPRPVRQLVVAESGERVRGEPAVSETEVELVVALGRAAQELPGRLAADAPHPVRERMQPFRVTGLPGREHRGRDVAVEPGQ